MFNRTSYLIYILLLTIIMLTFSHELHAVPAAPAFRTLTQPDGTAFRARQWGDEWSHTDGRQQRVIPLSSMSI